MEIRGLVCLLTIIVVALPIAGQGSPGVAVTGRVVDENGEPIAGAAIGEYTASLRATAEILSSPTTRSNARGRFSIEIARPGTPFVAAPGRIAVWQSQPGISKGDATVDVGDVVLYPGITLIGRVVDSEGRGVGGCHVTATVGASVHRLANQPSRSAVTSGMTEANGIFRLPCAAPAALTLTCRAEGYYVNTLAPVAHGMPLRVELLRSGFVSGRVVDGEGRGIKTWLTIVYEVPAKGRRFESEDDGSFRASLAYPTRYRVRGAFAQTPIALSPILHRPATEVLVRPSQARAGAEDSEPVTLKIRAVAAADLAPIDAFRVAVHWNRSLDTRTPWHFVTQFDRRATDAVSGELHVPVPAHRVQGRGALHLRAEGFAEAFVNLGKDDVVAPVRLAKSRPIVGTVRNEATGEPVVGARAWAIPFDPGFRSRTSYSGVPQDAVTTGKTGEFQIPWAADGLTYSVQVAAPDYLVPATVIVPSEGDEASRRVDVKLQSAASITGKLEVPRGRPGWLASIERVDTPRDRQHLNFIARRHGLSLFDRRTSHFATSNGASTRSTCRDSRRHGSVTPSSGPPRR